MAGTISDPVIAVIGAPEVSMESGLDGRNNARERRSRAAAHVPVSMESGLDGRNNAKRKGIDPDVVPVSMESGLDGRNN